jgi:hypothetical protein
MGTGQTAHSFIKRNASRELGRFWRAAQDGGLRDVPATFADLADTSHARLGAERGVGGYTLRRFRLVVCQKVFIISTISVFAGWDINRHNFARCWRYSPTLATAKKTYSSIEHHSSRHNHQRTNNARPQQATTHFLARALTLSSLSTSLLVLAAPLAFTNIKRRWSEGE